jgi:Flp pilus assembly protein TadG
MRNKSLIARLKDEDGQAIVLVALAMGIFLLAAVGLAVDGSTLYTHRQMAQAAADAAAQAGIMSIFDGTNGAGTAKFSTSKTFTCTTTDAETPCAYARLNGFGGSATDTVIVSFPANSTVPGVNFSPSGTDPTSLIKVEVKRDVNTTLLRLLGTTVTTVRATAMAAIVDIIAPVPILITHPKLDGALSMNGNPYITICGGPDRSIQVNSVSATAEATVGNKVTVDLSHAGPLDTDGKCTTGTGADFGVWGGPSPDPTFTFKGGTKPGKYLPKASPIQDPLKDVPAPPVPATPGSQTPFAAGTTFKNQVCPLSVAPKTCTLLTPGVYAGTTAASTIDLTNTAAFMEPGIYYVQAGGFRCRANCDLAMASPAIADVTTGTGWNGTLDGTAAEGGVLIYNSGSGQIDIGSNGSVNLIGSPAGSIYKNILFFEDHTASANKTPVTHNPHSMGGNGGMTLTGTIYLTNTLATMTGSPAIYQELDLQGGPGSGTLVQGQIIVGALNLGGNGNITMNLNSSTTLIVRQVALVN